MNKSPLNKRREWPLAVIFSLRFGMGTLISIIVLSLMVFFYLAPRVKQEVEDRYASFAVSIV